MEAVTPSQRLSITLLYLATVVTSVLLKFSFLGMFEPRQADRQTVTEWKMRSSVDRIFNDCDFAQQIPNSIDKVDCAIL